MTTFEADRSRDPELRTVSADALLVDGSDTAFRQMIHNFIAIGHSMKGMREGFAKNIGVTGPQHELIMMIYRHNNGAGVGVSELASLLSLSRAFVTTETSKLVEQGLVAKETTPEDGRRVVLRVSLRGERMLAELSENQRTINDAFFGSLNGKDFRKLAELLQRIRPCSEQAESLASELRRKESSAGRGQPTSKGTGRST